MMMMAHSCGKCGTIWDDGYDDCPSCGKVVTSTNRRPKKKVCDCKDDSATAFLAGLLIGGVVMWAAFMIWPFI